MFLLKVDIKTIGDSEHDLVGQEGNGAGTTWVRMDPWDWGLHLLK